MKYLYSFLMLLLTLPSLQACPACSDAIAASASSGDDVEISDFPRAMNQSIYVMVGVPYVALGIVGFLIYRGCKKNAAYLQASHRIEPVS